MITIQSDSPQMYIDACQKQANLVAFYFVLEQKADDIPVHVKHKINSIQLKL